MPGASSIPPGPEQPAGTRRPRSRRRLGIIGAIAAVLAGVGGKIGLGLLTAGVVGATLGVVFGGPFDKLPSDQQRLLQGRFDAAVGQDYGQLSESEATARVHSLLTGGLPRLDDATLLEYDQIWMAGVAAVDPGTCAAVARTTGGQFVDPKVTDRILGRLETQQLGRWYEISVQAMEAQARGAPAARTVSSSDEEAMFSALGGVLSAADMTSLQAISDGKAIADADACSAYKNLYSAGLGLPDPARGTFVLYDVTP